MIIGSISENKELEKRISITPDIARKYVASGFQILLEAGYGSHLGISDEEFLKEDCKIEKKGPFKIADLSEVKNYSEKREEEQEQKIETKKIKKNSWKKTKTTN